MAPVLTPAPEAPVVTTTRAATAETAAEADAREILEYTILIYSNPNAFNTFGSTKYDDTEANTAKYEATVRRCHGRLVCIVADATDPEKNEPGDKKFHSMSTIQVPINELRKDYLFCKFVSGPKTGIGKNYMNQALKIWTTNI